MRSRLVLVFGLLHFLTFGTVFERLSSGFRRPRRFLVASGWVSALVGVLASSFVVLFVVFSAVFITVLVVEPVLIAGF